MGVVLLLAGEGFAGAREEPLQRLSARLACPTRAGAGRIVCQLTVTAPPGVVLRWADVLVVRAPEFARPLRSRVAASLPEEGAAETQIAVPLFATTENTGTLEVRARAVVCPEDSTTRCLTRTRQVAGAVAVTREERNLAPSVEAW